MFEKTGDAMDRQTDQPTDQYTNQPTSFFSVISMGEWPLCLKKVIEGVSTIPLTYVEAERTFSVADSLMTPLTLCVFFAILC